MPADSNKAWKCKCGHIERGEFPPEDCRECLRLNKFTRVPEDRLEEAEAKAILSSNIEEEDD